MNENTASPKSKVQAIRLIIVIGLILTTIKFTAYYFTKSTAILTDALESIVNLLTGLFAWFSLLYSAKLKDQDHPYGHGKIENISAGFEGGLIFLGGLLILVEAGYNLMRGHKAANLEIGIVLSGVSALLVFGMSKYLMNKGIKHDSITLIADAKHLKTDAITTAGLIVGLGLVWLTKLYWLDALLGIALSLFIIYEGYKLIKEAFDGLMDKADYSTIEKIIKVLNKNRQTDWVDIHNLRLQKFGNYLHVDCHVTLPFYYDLQKTHDHMEAIDDVLNKNFNSHFEFFIHPDPCKPTACSICLVESCPERKTPFNYKVEWKLTNVMKNQAHHIDSHLS